MVPVVVSGACGRMGQKIIEAVATTADLRVKAVIEAPGHSDVGQHVRDGLVVTSELGSCLAAGDVLVEFSTPEATIAHLEAARAVGAAVLIGTTGLTAQQEQAVKKAAAVIPVLMSHNYGIGMNVFWELVRQATRLLGDEYQVEIVEFHGSSKRDVPSGTGLTIAGVIAAELGESLQDVLRFGRERSTGNQRKRHEIGMHSLRAGSYRSDHTVVFAGDGERLELAHREEDPKIIARGVLWGARFLREQDKGLYAMPEVLRFMREAGRA